MKVTCIFFVIFLNQFIGHCSSSRDEPSTSKTSTELQRIPSDRSLRQLQVENVQLTEYKNGEMIELQQQDFFHLQKEAFRENKLFRDPQFPKELFLKLGQEALRPKDIVKKPQEPILFIDNKKFFYVKQGRLGDCWFLVGLVHLQYHPNLFQFIVQPYDQTFNVNNYAGIFHFRFWQAGTWVDVVIDDRLPTEGDKLVYTSSGYSNEFWPALIEKAYAKLLYRSYGKLWGGFPKMSMQDLSGGISETYVVKGSSNNLFKIIYDAKDRSTMISCATVDGKEFEKFGTSVFSLDPSHSYAITAVKIVTGDKTEGEFKLIRIRDPYGKVSLDLYHGNIKYLFTEATLASKLDTKVDGESWILYDDFINYFSFIDICNFTPNKIIGHVYSNTGNKLALSAVEGKFMGSVTPQQIVSNDFYTINPLQYRMVLTKADEGKSNCNVLIGVSLKRRHDLQNVLSSIYFQLIKFSNYDDNDDITKVSKPLITSSIKCYELGKFYSLGQVSKRIDLELGTYYIIPFITDTFKGATFYLQILSEQQNILEVYDRDIHMPHITEKLKNLLTKKTQLHKIDHEIFSQMASDLTINFKELYNILKDDKLSLNENCHIAQELDDTVVLELELLATKKLVPQRKLSHLTIAKTLLITQEVFEIYGEKDCPGYIKNVYILTVLKRNGYFINMNIFNAIYALFSNRDILIHFDDYISIVFAIKNKFGSNCEEFNAKLCQDLVLMVHNGDSKVENFNEPQIHESRINIQQFNFIIKFIKNLKEIFYKHASGPYFSVAFEKLKNLLDAFDYKLTYDIIATIFHTHGNDVDIFYNQFVQSVVDVTLIFEKIQKYTSSEKGENLNKVYHKMFEQLWQKKQEKKYTFKNNKRQADEPANNESPFKKI